MRKIINWVIRGRFYFTSIIVALSSIIFIICNKESIINIFSLVYTISGSLIVLRQLDRDHKEYKEYAPENFHDWFMSLFMKTSASSVKGYLEGKLEDSTLTSFGIVRDVVKAQEEVEITIDKINNNFSNIDSNLSYIMQEQREITNRISQLESLTGIKTGEVKKDLIKHIVGTYPITFLGIIMTICGVILSIWQ